MQNVAKQLSHKRAAYHDATRADHAWSTIYF